MKQDQRRAARKQLDAEGVLSMGGVQYKIRTVDVAAGGLAVYAAKQLPVGRDCHVNFEMPLRGQMQTLAVSAHVVYCFFRGDAGYKIGLQFLQIHADGAALLAEYVGPA